MLEIRVDDLTDVRVHEFLAAHLRDMRSTAPPESCHVLDLTGLRQPEITMWTAWEGEQLIATAALKRLDATHGEVKSMRTDATVRQRGIGGVMLTHLMREAQAMGISRLSLETGAMAFFVPARALYEKHGFAYCAPFGDYRDDPSSVFMTRAL